MHQVRDQVRREQRRERGGGGRDLEVFPALLRWQKPGDHLLVVVLHDREERGRLLDRERVLASEGERIVIELEKHGNAGGLAVEVKKIRKYRLSRRLVRRAVELREIFRLQISP
jgi:hypothetical protein